MRSADDGADTAPDPEGVDPLAAAEAVVRAAQHRTAIERYEMLVMNLRRAGADWKSISIDAHRGLLEHYPTFDLPAWSPAECRQAYQERLAESRIGDLEEMRLEEVDRLGRLQAAWWSKATSGDADAAVLVLRIIAMRADILGLRQQIQRLTIPVKDELTAEEKRVLASALQAVDLDEINEAMERAEAQLRS